MGPVLDSAKISLATQVATLGQLAEKASGYPYYKYNGIWTRALQETVSISHLFLLQSLSPLIKNRSPPSHATLSMMAIDR